MARTMLTKPARLALGLVILAGCDTGARVDGGLVDAPSDVGSDAPVSLDVPDRADTPLNAADAHVGMDASMDSDSGGLCGDGSLDLGERCDPGIAAGAGACPTTCDDTDPCTVDSLEGAACDVRCAVETVTAGAADACCPSGATSATDPDCAAACAPVVGPEVWLHPGARTSQARVHFNGSVYGVAVAENANTGNVFFATYDRSGAPVLAPTVVSQPHATEEAAGYGEIDLTWDGSSWGVVMVRQTARADRSRHDAVVLRTVATDGTLGPLLDADAAFPRTVGSITRLLVVHHPTAGFAALTRDNGRDGSTSVVFELLGTSGGSPSAPVRLGTAIPSSWVLAADGTFGVLGFERNELWFATVGVDGGFLSGPTTYGASREQLAHGSLAHDGDDWIALFQHYRGLPSPETTYEVARGPALADRHAVSTYVGMDVAHWSETVIDVVGSELIAVSLYRPTRATSEFRSMLTRLDISAAAPAAPRLISTGNLLGTTTSARTFDLAAADDGRAFLVWTDSRRGAAFLDTYGQLITYVCP